MISRFHLEGIARDIHEQTALDPPVDAIELAQLCGFVVCPWWRASGALVGQTIYYPARARLARQHGIVAHELGHWALRRAGEDDRDEDAAKYLAGALVLPRAPFLADCRESDWDLFALREKHPYASAEMLAVRMTQVSPTSASVWDCGRLHRVYGEQDIAAARTLVNAALACEQPVAEGRMRAWPVIDGVWRRVLVVAA